LQAKGWSTFAVHPKGSRRSRRGVSSTGRQPAPSKGDRCPSARHKRTIGQCW
jgi:hypothetical protein